jgi:hypothetical protein
MQNVAQDQRQERSEMVRGQRIGAKSSSPGTQPPDSCRHPFRSLESGGCDLCRPSLGRITSLLSSNTAKPGKVAAGSDFKCDRRRSSAEGICSLVSRAIQHSSPSVNCGRSPTYDLRAGFITVAVINPELLQSVRQTVTHSETGTIPTVPRPRFPGGHVLRSKPRCASTRPVSPDAPGSGCVIAYPQQQIRPASNTVAENFSPALVRSTRWQSSRQRSQTPPLSTATDNLRFPERDRILLNHPDGRHLASGVESQAETCHPLSVRKFPSAPSRGLNFPGPTENLAVHTASHFSPQTTTGGQFSLLPRTVKRS